MKKGFTMIELIFVIVILGILAAVAIPKLAATRDDAKLASIKTDIGSTMQAVPAWYQGQKDARIIEGIQLDSTSWVKGTRETYTWSEDGEVCVTIAVVDQNGTSNLALNVAGSGTVDDATVDINSSNGRWLGEGTPVLRLVKGTLNDDGNVTDPDNISTNCETLWDTTNGLGLVEQTVSMGGKKVVW